MTIINLLLSALSGYLIGSISFARIIFQIFGKDNQLQDIKLTIPSSDVSFHSDSVSATTINVQLGPKYGCLTSLLDMGKVGLPALLLKIIFPESPYYLVLLTFGTIGHIWPIYYNFKGGRGMSTIIAGMLLADWMGLLVTLSISLFVGWIRKESYVWNRLASLLMIPWVWIRHQSWELLIYTIVVNLLFNIASIPETREMSRLRKAGRLGDFLRTRTLIVDDPLTDSKVERESFIGMLTSILSRKTSKNEETDQEPGTED
jgi:glycerol-3-phosphate acyltransferase PlsY